VISPPSPTNRIGRHQRLDPATPIIDRRLLRRRSIVGTIPERRDQAASRRRPGALGGRPPTFDKVVYRDGNVVERCSARLKQFRALATRFVELADRYRAGVVWLP
jgi:transposase